MTKVLKEAEARDIQSIYTFVRVDNKVSIAARPFSSCLLFLKFVPLRPGLPLRENLVLCPKAQVSMIQPLRPWRKSSPRRRKLSKTTDQFSFILQR